MNKFLTAIIDGEDPLNKIDIQPVEYPVNYDEDGYHFKLRANLREVEHGVTYPDNYPREYAEAVRDALCRLYALETGKHLTWREIESYDDVRSSDEEKPF